MTIERKSMVSGHHNSMELNITSEQLAAWKGGELIQVAMPDLSPEEREFVMTGITGEEWRLLFTEVEWPEAE